MTVLVSNRTSAEEVIRQEDLQISPDAFIDERLSVSQVEETQVIEITYSDTDPQRAQRVANTFGDVFSERIANLDSGASAITATVVESAVVPGGPVSPNPLRDGLLAAAVGIIIGAGLALLLDFLNDRWRSPEELEQFSGVPVFGIIPRFEAPRGGKVQESKKKGKG
jgi:capsular polysaccharide biosynthesis protein